MHELFTRQARLTPDAVAVACGGATMSYAELEQRSNLLAHYLRKQGVGPEVIVGVCLGRNLDLLVTLIGIHKAGGAYLPLDPGFPAQRLQFMLKDAGVKLVLTLTDYASVLEKAEIPILCIDDNKEWQEEHLSRVDQKEGPVERKVRLEDLAYVIYTSGSTGFPKGVAIPHRGLVNYLVWAAQAYQVGVGCGAPVHTSVAFDLAMTSLFTPLLVGKTVFLLSEQGEIEELAKLMSRGSRFSLVKLTPAHLELLARLIPPDKAEGGALALVIGGEALRTDQLAFFRKYAPQTRLINEYGPTETVVGCCTYEAPRPGPDPGTLSEGSVPIGKPVAGAELYLLDKDFHPVPSGEIGEIFIGGPGVGRGYLNHHELTAEKFLPDPFSSIAGARLYRSGDLARQLPDGNLEYLGRIDDQVKFRGYRIELAEIESILSSHSEVAQAAVVISRRVIPEGRLAAYVVPTPGSEISSRELKDFLSLQLPEYMLPSSIMFLEALPLTQNGKVDRKALPETAFGYNVSHRAYRPPQNELERLVCDIWEEVLWLKPVGVADDFFELGGHSLLACRAAARLSESLHLELPFTLIFTTRNVTALAREIAILQQGDQRASSSLELPPVRLADRSQPLPLTFGQEQVWFLQQLAPGNLAYNAQSSIHFRGPLQVDALQRTLQEIVRRHEIYRTTIETRAGRPVQVIHEKASVELPLVDLTHMPSDERQASAERQIVDLIDRPFDAGRLPLICWTLFRLAADEHILLQTEHHFVHDGWSYALLLEELQIIYSAFLERRPNPLPELEIQFVDYAAWQRRIVGDGHLDSQLANWKGRLSGKPPVLAMPLDHPRPHMQSFRGSSIWTSLEPELYSRLKEFCARQGVTLFITLLAAFKALLFRYTGQLDLWVGSGFANRGHRASQKLIGMLVNEVVLRTDMSGDPTFQQLVVRVRDVVFNAQANQDFPFARLVEELQPDRDLSYNPLFQVMFSFHDSSVPVLEFPGSGATANLSAEVRYYHNDAAKFDLNVIVIPRAEQLAGLGRVIHDADTQIRWEFNIDLFEPDTIQRLANHFLMLLHSALANPESHLSELEILDVLEKNKLLVEWNRTWTDYPRQAGIQRLFEEQVRCSPDATALVFSETHLTYRQLNSAANRLAHRLMELGVSVEIPVAICAERSPEMIVGLLAILKAGGAYLPLELDFPPSRPAGMLQEAKVPLILVQPHLRKRLPVTGVQILELDQSWIASGGEESQNISDDNDSRYNAQAENLAYILFTSGSTGQPKGVCIPHRAVVRLVINNPFVTMDSTERFLQFAPLSFDASTFEIWGSLLNGAALVIYPPGLPSLAELGRFIRDTGITTLWLTAGLFHQMIETVPETLHGVRQLLAGGDVLSPSYVRRAIELLPNTSIINGYGPTESTTFACCFHVPRWVDFGSTVPIGRPIANTQVVILDSCGKLVPIGVPGELYIGGDGLARGYLNHPELTQEKFILSPFDPSPGVWYYRTGDKARYRPDGNIEFLGRLDFQVKLRGFRIEPGEIEAALQALPNVGQAVVILRQDSPQEPAGEKRLVAFVTPSQSEMPRVHVLRQALSTVLPDYMLPSVIHVVDTLPLTPNGKVDRQALASMDVSPSSGNPESVEPDTPLELILADIWSELLKRPVIGRLDDFFNLGGHSLLAIRLVAKLSGIFEVELPVRLVFEHPTVAKMAQALYDLPGAGARIERIAALMVQVAGSSEPDTTT